MLTSLAQWAPAQFDRTGETYMPNAIKWMPLAAAITAMLAVTPVVSKAQMSAPAHEHAEHGKLTLNHGKKWPTDDALRTGMNNIRKLVEPQLPAVHADKLAAAQYGELARKVEAEVGFVVANCKLDPKADAMLHLVIADIGGGVDAMAAKNPSVQPAQGATTVVAALNEYGRYFNHPGWKPIRAAH
jgi:hypothetical protein